MMIATRYLCQQAQDFGVFLAVRRNEKGLHESAIGVAAYKWTAN
jgi:hypothetical protein